MSCVSFTGDGHLAGLRAADADTGVRFSVARNDRVTAEVLEILVVDASAGVRGWVAANPQASPDLLDALAADPDRTVRDLVTWSRRWEGRVQA